MSAWKNVDLPTLARPTWVRVLVWYQKVCAEHVHTIPLFKLLPGRPSSTFSCLTSFFGGIFFFLLLA